MTDESATEEVAWETTATGIDYACPGFDVRRDEVRFPDGTDAEYHYVDEPPAVVILPFTPDGDAVVIEEWRQAVGRVNRGLPAGGMEPEDAGGGSGDAPSLADLRAAAARELAEETGYEAEAFEHLITVEPSNGIANSVHHHFVATGCEPTAEQDLDHNESIRVRTADYDDLLAAVVDGDCRDGRTALAVTQYELTRR
ncbi:NUDIX hydrolase [Haloparvum sedimenti]|uniref:NUDIX hydrolase n=1 Tax=Haloparvum sedimenti TaxID=1678448 RepID=UPI00071E756D|nr:NUDIX hydrolase [Haloparvum sedimenti]